MGRDSPTWNFDIAASYHEEGGKSILSYEQDVEPIAETIKHGETRRWLSPEKEMRIMAEIPIVILMEWAKQRGMTYGQLILDDGELRKFLRDPANSLWRL